MANRKNKTPRAQEIVELTSAVHDLVKEIDTLIEEPIDTKKINGLILARAELRAFHDDAKRLRAPKVRERIERQQGRVREALGMLPAAR